MLMSRQGYPGCELLYGEGSSHRCLGGHLTLFTLEAFLSRLHRLYHRDLERERRLELPLRNLN